MNNIIQSFDKINSNIDKLKPKNPVNIVAVSKTFSLDHIKPLIDYGHNHFGENKVQEAIVKWKEIKQKKNTLKLHMVGKLQSNKVNNAIDIFDYVHSLDNQKLADKLSNAETNKGRNLKYFVQVNIGNELQKSGIPINDVEKFCNYCSVERKLNILGLMIIPPNDKNSKKYFEQLNYLNNSLGFKDSSMGMSSDYENAIINNATYVRVGSSIFGSRTK